MDRKCMAKNNMHEQEIICLLHHFKCDSCPEYQYERMTQYNPENNLLLKKKGGENK